jgi:hypothetical protein
MPKKTVKKTVVPKMAMPKKVSSKRTSAKKSSPTRVVSRSKLATNKITEKRSVAVSSSKFKKLVIKNRKIKFMGVTITVAGLGMAALLLVSALPSFISPAGDTVLGAATTIPTTPTGFRYDNLVSNNKQLGLRWDIGQQTIDGYFIYCDQCSTQKINISRGNTMTSSVYGEINYWNLDIKPSTEYSLQLTAYRNAGGIKIESKKTAIIKFTTPTN